MVASVFLSLIYLFFPLCCYFIYLVYSKAIYEKEKMIFFDLALFSSFYFSSKFGNLPFSLAFLMNIPILLAIYKKRLFSSLVLSFLTAFFLAEIYQIPYYIYLLQYLIIFLLGFFSKYKLVNIFEIIKILFGLCYLVVFSYKITNIRVLFLTFILFVFMYLVFYVMISFYEKVETIVKMHSSLEKITKEKKLYESLFKITHEIKNPLAVCKGYLDMFDINNPAKANRYIGIINQEIDRTLLLLQDFSNVSKLNIEKNPMEINMLLEDVCDEAGLILKNDIKFKSSIGNYEVYIKGDYNRLKQVLINVIKNAKEAIDNNGLVELKAKAFKNKYIITIKDNGVGMDKETSNKIGTAFYTTKKNGTGLGVCFSKEIIEKHDGTMEYISKQGKGTMVKITLPIEKASTFK